ncbi:MAG: hypothetical protein O3C52_01875 [Proteobacteria bacterium]|nr:hypothetical protein [Pseudomonadota bacterium]MDA0914839.1 hypothetical protein [Pseudomonadota bacterium]MDA1032116.1 hypothetical protein [Pseudomonadota bacterium]
MRRVASARTANGIFLPVIAGFLLYAMNQERLLGKHENKIVANVAGVAVLVIAAGLGALSVLGALWAI